MGALPKARPVLIAGNWKMHKNASQARQFLENLSLSAGPCQARVYLAVPFTALFAAKQACMEFELPVKIGAQNMHDEESGAFTGEISASMIKEAGAEFVILGHSERRRLFHESNAFIQKKILRAFAQDLQPILCIGESKEERERSETHQVLEKQIFECLEGIEDLKNLILAYEPVWAIGTGNTACVQDAESTHQFCREVIRKKWGHSFSERVSILYGGSAKAENSLELVKQENVDGLLVGGASLSEESFSRIINVCCNSGCLQNQQS